MLSSSDPRQNINLTIKYLNGSEINVRANLSDKIGLFRHGCQMAKFDPFLSLDCARVEGVGAQSKERKGSNFAAQRSGAIVQKPKGPNT